MLSFRGSRRQKPVPKTVPRLVLDPVTVPTVSPPPLLDLAMAYNSSLKGTLGRAMEDNASLREKLDRAKKELKAAREVNKKLADYKEWRHKALLGFEAGYNKGAKQVLSLLFSLSFNFEQGT